MSDFYNLKVNINKAQSTKRLDKALTNILGKFSRSHIKILIENGNVKKNNKIINEPSHLVKDVASGGGGSTVTSHNQSFNITINSSYSPGDILRSIAQAGAIDETAYLNTVA